MNQNAMIWTAKNVKQEKIIKLEVINDGNGRNDLQNGRTIIVIGGVKCESNVNKLDGNNFKGENYKRRSDGNLRKD